MWAIAAVLAGLGAAMTASSPAAVPPASVAEEKPAGATISMPFDGGVTIPVTVDPALVESVEAHYAELYKVRGPLFVMLDTYDTNPAAAAHCAAGHERWVRVLDLPSRKEIFHRHVESCAKGWTVGDPILTFAADGNAFTVHRTSAPELTVVLDPEAGTARVADETAASEARPKRTGP